MFTIQKILLTAENPHSFHIEKLGVAALMLNREQGHRT